MANSMTVRQVFLVFAVCTTLVLLGEGVQVSIGSMLSSNVSVHCLKGQHDEGVRVVKPKEEYFFTVSVEYHGPYVCALAAAGKKATFVDVVHTNCNCNTYYGCAWVVRKDGFYCNHEFMRTWA